MLLSLDENAEISTLGTQSTHRTELNGISGKEALKVKVYGNGSEEAAILISLTSKNTIVDAYRIDYLIPLNFTGWREVILMDNDNGDYGKFSFSNTIIPLSQNPTDYYTYRYELDLGSIRYATITTTGDVTGVKMDDILAYTPSASPAKNIKVTIGGNTITFDTTLKSGEYLEYYPEENKAYHYYYDDYTAEGATISRQRFVKEISFTGSVEVPTGDFTFTYSATSAASIFKPPLRAEVTIGLTDYVNVIKNPDNWNVPDVYVPENSEKVKLR